ncbi:NAD(P)(+) transhydrogenase (Re/Si-specific) subunit beta [uncultured Oceanicoccus sp.]|uniref:NAD(P)(+) transhydrogenase (Re/Si-specific) subunit beta n=1 Tax=uncultured Oceanicoccus sp. TaxID=1706381 RepID=UPI0030D84FDA
MTSLNFDLTINLAYIVSAVLFVFGLKRLSSPATARQGNLMSAAGMLIAIVVTLMNEIKLPWENIIAGLIIGGLIGAVAARKVEMTGMPELVALFNGFGGASSLLVGLVAVFATANSTFTSITIIVSILIGGVTLTGSLIAYGKLSERLPSKAIQFTGQQIFNGALVIAIIVSAVLFIQNPSADSQWLYAVIGLSLVLGIMITIPIGGADMPVVIALLNSYSGLAACAAGFVLNNNLLIVSGSLVGASGLILTNIMCKAMNRSLNNVLFSGFGAAKVSSAKIEGEVKPISADDAFLILEAAQNVAIVPGYGMAVAQAQHVVRELSDHLEENGCDVKFAIHPVAGRMPGHMNVLLAEANVPYDQLVEMDDINPQMSNMDVAIVIGANDVVNPAANEDEGSPLYGMPVINVNEARTVFVLKRSMGSGFSGVDNPLFFGDNTRMLFGDAKESISHIVGEFKG